MCIRDRAETTVSLGDPSANIAAFNPPIATANNFLVSWVGSAAPGASIVAYTVQFRFNNGPWQTWLTNVAVTSAQFSAILGDGTYAFQVQARDSTGRVSPFFGGPGSGIALDMVAPFITIRDYMPAIPSY